jgi:hypothetical protein
MTSTDDREARAMLDPLAGEPSGEQWLDLDHIVREGDRRRRGRTAVTGVFTAVFLTAVAAGTAAIVVNGRQGDGVPAAGRGSPSAEAAPYLPYAATGPDCPLAPLPGTTGLLAAVDHTGHYTLQEASGGGKTTVTVRKDGAQVAQVRIPALGQGEYDLNARGEFTALFTDVTKDRLTLRSYVYEAGKLTTLKVDDIATDIADDGRIAGVVKGNVPARWERPDAEPSKLAVPRGKQAQVLFLDQDGTILGYANSEAAEFANLWLPDGSSRPIPVSEGQRSPTMWGIANGWVTGFDDAKGFRYNVGTKKFETLPAQIRRPQMVAANGAVAGDNGMNGNLYLLDGGMARKLSGKPSTVEAPTYRVLGISDDGRTVTGNEFFHDATSNPAGDAASNPAREKGRAVTWSCG